MKPQPITFMENHDMICRLLDSLPRGSVLDVPCGRGALSVRLAAMGFQISCCDLDKGLFELTDFELRLANLNRGPLPFDNEAFDYVVCVNGLHRIYNIDNAIREFARCLKRDGKVFISFPNYATLARRVGFLFHGSIGRGINNPAFTQTEAFPEVPFRHPILYPQVKFALERHGLTNIRLYRSRRPTWLPILLPLGLVIKFVGLLCYHNWQRYYRVRETCSSEILFGSHHLFIEARFSG